MRPILTKKELRQRPLPGEVQRSVEVRVLGPEPDPENKKYDPDFAHVVVVFKILELEEGPDGELEKFEKEQITVRLGELVDALVVPKLTEKEAR